jgi:DNA-binding NtrC family response regulator
MKTILIVDDDENIFHSLAMILKPVKAKLLYCASIDCAEKILLDTNSNVHLVLLDLAVDRRSGLDLLDLLSTHDISMPVIMISGTDAASPAVAAIHKGAVDYITKPFSGPDVCRRVQSRLSLNK